MSIKLQPQFRPILNCLNNFSIYKKIILLFLLYQFRVLTLTAQDIHSSSPLVLPQAPATNYVVVPGQTVKVSSGKSIVLGPGTWLQQGSLVTVEISNSPVIKPAPFNPAANLDRNWVHTKNYDENGVLILEAKSFFDNTGKSEQKQVRNISAGHVLASQTVYDALGRPAIRTLSAPINNSAFNYKEGFVTSSSGGVYNYNNFDLGKVNNPDAIGTGAQGTLGWYYSDNNDIESYQATTGYPYVRETYFSDGSAMVNKSSGVGEQLKNGSGHEASAYIMPVVNELNHYLQIRNKFFSEDRIGVLSSNINDKDFLLSVGTDVNGAKGVTISDASGKSLLAALADNSGPLTVDNAVTISAVPPQYKHIFRSGGYLPNGEMGGGPMEFTITSIYNVEVYMNGSLQYSGVGNNFNYGPTDMTSREYEVRSAYPFTIHGLFYEGYGEPAESSLKSLHYFSLLQPGQVNATGSYELVDMSTETQVSANAILPAGYYKLRAINGNVSLSYSNKLANINYQFYNQLGQLVANIAPEGVKALIANGLNAYNSLSEVPFVTLNEYDLQGRLVAGISTDGGRSEFIYRKDGSIRFSQNAEQRKSGRFSYTNYDRLGRSFESGEYLPGDISFASAKINTVLQENTDENGGLTGGTRRSQVMTHYDLPENSHGLSSYVQDEFYLKSAISWTENEGAKTWYNYDSEGRLSWVIKQINGLGLKTIDYTYLPDGHVQTVDFQKNVPSERFVHHYTYDADQRLEALYTSLDGINKQVHAKYYYYLHGPLKRVELGDKLQGLDYTYTPQGWLKSINHPNGTVDPGKDGIYNSFAPDAFAMTLEYFSGDYNRSNTGISSIVTNTSRPSYNGNVSGQSWKSLKPGSIVGLYGTAVNNPEMFTYEYNNNNQFAQNIYGVPDFGNNSFIQNSSLKNREFGLTYDTHGNIQNLTRSNATGANTQLNYHYIPNTNKLQQVDNYFSYSYDDLGQMVGQSRSNGQGFYLSYDVNGKVKAIYSDAGLTQLRVSYGYDESGFRIRKTDHTLNVTTYYVYDESGNMLSVYDNNGGALQQKELSLYASGRIGIYNRNNNGYLYELNDNLGNVRVVLSQNKIDGKADVVSYSDYYPFGSPISLAGNDYRYGYQGQYSEADKETGWNNFEARMYDPAIGRWLSVDPAGQFYSPYVGMGNNPVISVDPDGRFIGTILGAIIGGGIKAIQGGSWKDIGKGALAGAVGGAVFDLAIATGGASVGVMLAAGAMGGMAQEITNQALFNYSNPRAVVTAGMWGMAGSAIGAVVPNMGRIVRGLLRRGTVSVEQATATVMSESGEALNSANLIRPDVAKGGMNGLSKTISVQKQARHIAGTAKEGGGFLNSVDDAQSVLNAVHSGKATFLGTSKAGHQIYRFNGVTGTNVNLGAGISGQPTNIFMIKGTTSPSVVPTSPLWKP